jgi:hypothetical protein
MNKTYICDRCPRVAVIVEDDDVLLCGECFLARTVHVTRRKRALALLRADSSDPAPQSEETSHRRSA